MIAATSPLRILLVGLNFAPEPTGIAPYTARIVAALVAEGHEVAVLTTHAHYPWWRFVDGRPAWTTVEVIDGAVVTRLRHRLPKVPVGVARALSELSFGARAVGRRWRRPDVVVAVSPALLATAAVVARARAQGIPVGVIVQDLYTAGAQELQAGRGARLVGVLESWVLRRADAVSVIHQRFLDRLRRTIGIDGDRVTVIRNWTHLAVSTPPERDAARGRLGWDDDRTIVLHAGAMGEKQGLVDVVEAARIAHGRGLDLLFLLVGDGGQRAALEVAGRGLPTLSIRPPLPDSEFVDALAGADLLLVHERPGVGEVGVPSKLTSYFLAGVPVLAAVAANGTAAEEVRAAGAGLVVPPGSPSDLVDAVLAAVSDDRRAVWARAGRAYCDEILGEETALRRYVAWVEGLAGSARFGYRGHQGRHAEGRPTSGQDARSMRSTRVAE